MSFACGIKNICFEKACAKKGVKARYGISGYIFIPRLLFREAHATFFFFFLLSPIMPFGIFRQRFKGPRKRGNIVAETLLLVMFPRRANEWEAKQMFCFLAAQTKKHFTGICCGRKMFLKKFRNIFCVRNKCYVRAQTGKHLRPQQFFRNNFSATMFPRLRSNFPGVDLHQCNFTTEIVCLQACISLDAYIRGESLVCDARRD